MTNAQTNNLILGRLKFASVIKRQCIMANDLNELIEKHKVQILPCIWVTYVLFGYLHTENRFHPAIFDHKFKQFGAECHL